MDRSRKLKRAAALASLVVLVALPSHGVLGASSWLEHRTLSHRVLAAAPASNSSTSAVAPLPAPAPANSTAPKNASAPSPAGNSTGSNTTLASPPPAGKNHTSAKDKIHDEINKMKNDKGTGERVVAIIIGVVMLLGILVCLLCCFIRKGGQWRVPMPAFIRRRFGPKDKYSRYTDNAFDDGF